MSERKWTQEFMDALVAQQPDGATGESVPVSIKVGGQTLGNDRQASWLLLKGRVRGFSGVGTEAEFLQTYVQPTDNGSFYRICFLLKIRPTSLQMSYCNEQRYAMAW